MENYVVAQQTLQNLRLSWRTFVQIYIVRRKFIPKMCRLFVFCFEELHTENSHRISYIVCPFFLFMNFIILLQFWNFLLPWKCKPSSFRFNFVGKFITRAFPQCLTRKLIIACFICAAHERSAKLNFAVNQLVNRRNNFLRRSHHASYVDEVAKLHKNPRSIYSFDVLRTSGKSWRFTITEDWNLVSGS